MANGRGSIYDSSVIKRQLVEANKDYYGRKTWENLYSNVDLSKQQDISAAKNNYYNAMSDAYIAAQQDASNIINSNLGQGYKLDAIDDTNAILEQAYDSYRTKYLENMNDIEQGYGKIEQNITGALNRQAEFTTQFANAPYKYLEYLFDKYSAEDNNAFITDPLWKRYTNVSDDGTVSLKTWEEIAGRMGSKNDDGEYVSMFDENGNLTVQGIEFYDQLINQNAYTGKMESFDSWLSHEETDLHNWLHEYNPYDYNPKGNNYGSVTEMVGAEDQAYSFIERFGGMNKKQVDGMFDGVRTSLDNIKKSVTENNDTKLAAKGFMSLNEEVSSIANKLGIADDINKSLQEEYGVNLDQLGGLFAETLNRLPSEGEITAEAVLQTLGSVGVGTGVGAKIGTSAGPGGTAAGAVLGFFISAVVGGTTAAFGAADKKQKNKNAVSDMHSQYVDLIAALSRLAEEKRLEAMKRYTSI